MRSLSKLAKRRPARILPRTGEKPPKGYTIKYEWGDSDYVEHRRKVFVRKKKK